MNATETRNFILGQEYGTIKYVKVNGEYRFCQNEQNHKGLVNNGEKAESAGFIYYDENNEGKFLKTSNESSMTLCIGPDDGDLEAIGEQLNIKVIRKKKPWE